jgi:hypothetical protein
VEEIRIRMKERKQKEICTFGRNVDITVLFQAMKAYKGEWIHGTTDS